MKKFLFIGIPLVLVILLILGYFAYAGFKVKQMENIEAHKTPQTTVEKILEYYKSDSALDHELAHRFHSEDFKSLVTQEQLFDFYKNQAGIQKNTNVVVEEVSLGEPAVMKMINRDSNQEITVYLTSGEVRGNTIWRVNAYQVGTNILGNIPTETQPTNIP